MSYATRHLCKLYKVSPETIRNWSNEFADFLSVNANPPKGKQRRFVPDDLEVFSLVSEMKDRGATYEEIHASLKIGERGVVPEAILEDDDDELSLSPSTQEIQLAVRLQSLQKELARAEQERDEALQQLGPLKDENIRLKAQYETARDMYEARVKQLAEQLEIAQQRAESLIREAAQAYLKGLMQGQGSQSKSDDDSEN